MAKRAFSLAAGLSGLALAVAIGCSATNDPDGSGGNDGTNPLGDGDGIDLGGDGDGDGDGAGDGDKEVECTVNEAGEQVCVCIKLATWGALGTYGAVPGADGQDAIAAWLNENSTGEADYFAAKPVISAEVLGAYDVILIQDISAWAAFTPEEVAAFEAWLREGGGVITLNGYSANGLEMTNVNALLASTGLQYIPNTDTVGNDYVDCQYCYGSSAPMGGWVATHPIAANIKDVGAYYGRAISAAEGTEIVAQTAEGVLAAASSLDAGRVFMFHDEWVTYNSQWTGEGLLKDCRQVEDSCYERHPVNDYSSAQFWYNSIRWVSGEPACFDIRDETIVR